MPLREFTDNIFLPFLFISFDYHTSMDGQTGYNSPLYSNDSLNIDTTVNYFLNKGLDAHKLIVGISAYGQTYMLDGLNHDLNARTAGPGKPGPYSSVGGLIAYYETCYNTKRYGWTVVRDSDNNSGTIAYHDDQWISYDDVENIRAKAKYISEQGLGGGMIWTLDFDDFTARCGCGYYPLLTTLNQELGRIEGKPLHNCTVYIKD